jgi:hypothetical protein
MTVRALNFLEKWLEDNVPEEPFMADYDRVADALATRLADEAERQGIAVEEFGEEVENLTDFIREALENRAEYAQAVDAGHGP